MPSSTAQPKSRRLATLDNRVVADLAFFSESNRVKKHKAAVLLAEDELSDRELCKSINISTATLHAWKQSPEFQQVVGDYRGEIIAESLKLPIAKKHHRIRELNELNDSYWQIKNQRGAAYTKLLEDSPDNAALREFGYTVPEWATSGMLLAQPKIAANGKTVVEWAFDKALDSAIKETHKQAAQELGQWEESLSVTHSGTLQQEYVIVENVPWGESPDDDE